MVLVGVACLWASDEAPASPEPASPELERTRALIKAGALPRSALEKAEREVERTRLQARLRELASKSDLTPDELPEMTRAAARLVELARDGLRVVRTRVNAGALAWKQLQPAADRLESAERQRDLVETRVRLVRQLQAMAGAEERLEQLEEEELAFSYEGAGGVWWEDLDLVMTLYYEEFGRELPISADGDTLLHRSMGFDHTGRVDVALHPDDIEGFFLIEILESWGIPYIAFRSAVPGQATGPHMHIGLPSPRVELD